MLQRRWPLVGVLATLLLVGGLSVGQDKVVTTKKRLPSGWSKLNLTVEQKSKVYQIQADYKAKMEKLKADEKNDLMKVLTPDQKAKLDQLEPTTTKIKTKIIEKIKPAPPTDK